MEFKTEHQFQKWIADLAKKNGWKVYCHPDSRKSSQFSTPGFPDLVLAKKLYMKDRLVVIECKMLGRFITTPQKEWLLLLRDAGAEVFVFDPDSTDEIKKILTGARCARK